MVTLASDATVGRQAVGKCHGPGHAARQQSAKGSQTLRTKIQTHMPLTPILEHMAHITVGLKLHHAGHLELKTFDFEMVDIAPHFRTNGQRTVEQTAQKCGIGIAFAEREDILPPKIAVERKMAMAALSFRE